MQEQYSQSRNLSQYSRGERGLVNSLISGRVGSSKVRGTIGPGGITFKKSTARHPQEGHYGKRGAIYGFSADSRRRMLRWLSRLDWNSFAVYFATLTYREASVESSRWHRDLTAFRKRLHRRWGEHIQGVAWKLEFQRRGEPHFHLCIWWKRDAAAIGLFREWCARAWNEIAQPGDAAHLVAGTNVERAFNTTGRGNGALMRYLGKYMAKSYKLVDQSTGEIRPTGRVWGKWGQVPEVVVASIEMDEDSYVRLTRRIRRWGRESRYCRSLTSNWSGALVFAWWETVFDLLRGLEWESIAPG